MDMKLMESLKAEIREIPDWPKKGILFYDITTLLKQKKCFAQAIDALVEPYRDRQIDLVLGMEARGFIIAPTVAYALGAGFVPVRKPGKLPADKLSVEYELEYGTDTLEIHKDAVKPGQKVLIVDDLIATGGTAVAAARLAETMGATVEGFAFMVELTFLKGCDRLSQYSIHSLLKYSS